MNIEHSCPASYSFIFSTDTEHLLGARPHLGSKDMKASQSDMANGVYIVHVEEVGIEQDAHNNVIAVGTNTMTEKVGW